MVIWKTTPVAVLFFITSHRSCTVHEQEGAHEDVPRVGNTTILVTSSPETDRTLFKPHQTRTGVRCSFVDEQDGYQDNHNGLEEHGHV